MDNNELKHYGVPGMKWGVRRALIKTYKRLGKTQGYKEYYEDGSNNKIGKFINRRDLKQTVLKESTLKARLSEIKKKYNVDLGKEEAERIMAKYREKGYKDARARREIEVENAVGNIRGEIDYIRDQMRSKQ